MLEKGRGESELIGLGGWGEVEDGQDHTMVAPSVVVASYHSEI